MGMVAGVCHGGLVTCSFNPVRKTCGGQREQSTARPKKQLTCNLDQHMTTPTHHTYHFTGLCS
eukprot:m.176895 g.176895  ORF g.176895 m.176895 type:complete len:63 (+) comp25317_c0_seq4:1531-1719(+)